jgi:hypothetical protein
MEWIDPAQERDRWWTLLNAAMKLWVPYNEQNFLIENQLASQEGLYSME